MISWALMANDCALEHSKHWENANPEFQHPRFMQPKKSLTSASARQRPVDDDYFPQDDFTGL
jgi:hypothetical protein